MTALPPTVNSEAQPAVQATDLFVEDSAFVRLWQGLMTARAMVALALWLLLLSLYELSGAGNPWLVLLCTAYLAQTLAVRLWGRPRPFGKSIDVQWIWTIGVDLLVFCSLQLGQDATINYTPLFAIPVLIAAVMGSNTLALGTAAGVALLLLGNAYVAYLQLPLAATSTFVQVGLTGTAYLILAFLINQLAARLSGEEQSARRSQRAARVQTQVNELVIEFLEEGVLVVDSLGNLRTVNPAARRLLAWPEADDQLPDLRTDPGDQPLLHVARQTFDTGSPQRGDITVLPGKPGQRPLRVRTRLTTSIELQAERLCVVFLQDLREMEAKIRTEKLAAMGRMSAAVAHEIRNPLAAISQANALLDEDLKSPVHRRLTAMVQKNARRLSQIVEEILDITRVQRQPSPATGSSVKLNDRTRLACVEWARQTDNGNRILLGLGRDVNEANFDDAHLQRLLVNLLDNASRHASDRPDSIQVSTSVGPDQSVSLQVWSDGMSLEPEIQSRLFEPFFSSESRSTGLGLYICRELCERHGAHIVYQRVSRSRGAERIEGNGFVVKFRPAETTRALRDAAPMIAK